MHIDDKKLQLVAAQRHKEVCKDSSWQDAYAAYTKLEGIYMPGDELPIVIIRHTFPDEDLTDAHGNPIVRIRMECQSCNASGIMDIPYDEVATKPAKARPKAKDERSSNSMGGTDISHKYKG